VEWVTTTAKTLPEAIDLALDNLGVDESEAEIVVLEEPSKGLFGRTRGAARVEARVKPKAIRPKTDRGRSRRSRSNDGRGRQGSSGDRSGRRSQRSGGKGSGRSSNGSGSGRDGRSKQAKRSGQGGNGGGKAAGGGGKAKKSANASSNAESRQGKKPREAKRSNRPDQGSKTDSGGRAPTGAAAASSETGASTESSPSKSSSSRRRASSKSQSASAKTDIATNGQTKMRHEQQESPMEEVADHLRTFLGGLTEAFGLDGGVDVDETESNVLIATVQGQHGLMVGPKGRTLDAIQELARVSSQRAAPSSIRIRVDVGGYRQQRAMALGGFAAKAADKAVDNGSEVALEPMSPGDRKAVHDALVDDRRVETKSVGTEPRRRVIVIPVEGAAVNDEEE